MGTTGLQKNFVLVIECMPLTINDRACNYFACKKQRILARCLQRYFWRTSLLRWNSADVNKDKRAQILCAFVFIDIGTVCCNVIAEYRWVTGICILRLAVILRRRYRLKIPSSINTMHDIGCLRFSLHQKCLCRLRRALPLSIAVDWLCPTE